MQFFVYMSLVEFAFALAWVQFINDKKLSKETKKVIVFLFCKVHLFNTFLCRSHLMVITLEILDGTENAVNASEA